MGQDNLSISKIKRTYLLAMLLLVAVSFTQDLCEGEGLNQAELIKVDECINSIAVEGQICHIPLLFGPNPLMLPPGLYESREEYCCAAKGVYQSLPYFQVAPIEDPTDCDSSIKQ